MVASISRTAIMVVATVAGCVNCSFRWMRSFHLGVVSLGNDCFGVIRQACAMVIIPEPARWASSVDAFWALASAFIEAPLPVAEAFNFSIWWAET